MNVLCWRKKERKKKTFWQPRSLHLTFPCFSFAVHEVAVAYLESKVNEAMTQRVIAVICSHKGSRRAQEADLSSSGIVVILTVCFTALGDNPQRDRDRDSSDNEAANWEYILEVELESPLYNIAIRLCLALQAVPMNFNSISWLQFDNLTILWQLWWILISTAAA